MNIGVVINNFSIADLAPVPASDVNKNGQLDPGEDVDGSSDGVLTDLNAYLATASTNAPNGTKTPTRRLT